jgi:hypothetical protein
MAALTTLSSKDTIILDSLFNPEASSDQGIQIDESLPQDSSISSLIVLKQIHEQEVSAIRTLESQLRPHSTETKISGPSNDRVSDAAVQEALTSAIGTFNSIIESHPRYASAYANRAQCTAVQLTQSGYSAPEVLRHSGLMSDLETAIRLASPRTPAAPISTANARVLASTYTQRASLYLAASRYLEAQKMQIGGPVLQNCIPNRPSGFILKDDSANLVALLEEKASQDFFFGGRYGNKLAGAMVVKTNPYAKACGNVVKEAMRREMEG